MRRLYEKALDYDVRINVGGNDGSTLVPGNTARIHILQGVLLDANR